MKLLEDELFEKHGKHCGRCNRITFLPYEKKWACVPCGYNVIKRKHELSKNDEKKFINRLKYAEQKIFCICVDVYKLYEGNDYHKIYEILFTSRNNKLKKQYLNRKI